MRLDISFFLCRVFLVWEHKVYIYFDISKQTC